MTSSIDTSVPVWLPGDDPDAFDARIVPTQTDAVRLTVAVPLGTAVPEVELHEDRGVVSLRVPVRGTVRVTAVVPTADAVALWQPGSGRDHARIPASWEAADTASPLDGVALGALLGADDRATVSYGADAGAEPIRVRAGLVEETAELMVSFEVTSARAEVLTVHLDVTTPPFADAVRRMTERLTGPRALPALVDEQPVLCTWYFLHQSIAGEELVRQAAPAAALGFGSLIIDDGWQTGETGRGYGSAGDWAVEPAKIPDAARLVAAFEAHGIRTMWWIGTPFIGHRSDAFGASPIVSDEPALDAAVLDPRAPEARRHLVESITRLIRDTGSHGVKIDFLERFASRRLAAEVEPAALAMLDELDASLRAVRPDVSIEFREPYIGPAATARATMIRVGDCPMSPVRNRVGIVDLRLATNGIAVHADPVMWAREDSPERVAQHLQNTLFGVPQVSVDLTSLTPAHERVLAFWLRFAAENRELLLHGDFHPRRPDLNYPVVCAALGDVAVTARYQPAALDVPEGEWRRWSIVNADDPVVDLRGGRGDRGGSGRQVDITVQNAQGLTVAEFRGPLPERIAIPTGGLAEVRAA
jgi:alpha-galactosidase